MLYRHFVVTREGITQTVADGSAAPRLTQLSHGAGCACKLGPADLDFVRGLLPAQSDPELIVGLDPADDAAVYRLSPELALVQTIDFFTPIVDDPFDFGRIAAANALSDIYAMGARPLLALNVLAFPLDRLGTEVLGDMLRGGASVAADAGALIAGGHSIDDPEPKYGMAVTGIAHPSRIVTKAGGEPGDDLFLSKPVGGGLVTTAAKRGLAPGESLAHCVEVMTTLNDETARSALATGVHAMTDVTGFGLVGHLHELCHSSGLAAEVAAANVPTIAGVLELATDGRCVSGGTKRNSAHAAAFTDWGAGVDAAWRTVLTDAMTSGGLLSAVPANAAKPPGAWIGRLVDGPPGTITVR
jgi:selenide, water dikinase